MAGSPRFPTRRLFLPPASDCSPRACDRSARGAVPLIRGEPSCVAMSTVRTASRTAAKRSPESSRRKVRYDARRELDPATAYLTGRIRSWSDLTARFPWPSDAERQAHKKSDRNNSQKDQRNITRNAPARSLASFLSSIYLPASSFAAARRYPGE